MPKFCIGTDDFKGFVDEKGYFVDKSLLIKEVIEGSKVTLLPRPRRFGKTLNMSMLRYFFENSKDDNSYLYNGLKITTHPEYMRHFAQYPVIYISLKDIKGRNWEIANSVIINKISVLFRKFDYLINSLSPEQKVRYEAICLQKASEADYQSSFSDLISHLYEYHKKPVVVLIDEYDSPIIESRQKGYYPDMIDFMKNWLSGGLKHENGNALFKSVVTGILRVAKESLFSGLNNLKVASMLQPGSFADKFGFTQSELKQILKDFDLTEISKEIQEWYNGYKFGDHTI